MSGLTEALWRRRPANMKRRQKNGVWYFSYVDPETGSESGLGTDYAAAREAVHVVNAERRAAPVQSLVARIQVAEFPWGKHLDWFDANVLSKWRSRTGKPMAEESLYIRRLYLAKLKAHFKEDRETASIKRKDVAKFLELQTPQQHNRYRQLLDQIFRHAISRGAREDNPITLTVKVQFQKDRQRLTLAQFNTIRSKAPVWLQRAMDLALWSLQRREDLATWKVGEHWRDGKLYVRQGKVEGHGTGLLCVHPGKKLLAALVACLNAPDRGDCPYIVCHRPSKKRKAKGRLHDFQVLPDTLTREFKRIADENKVFEGLTEEQKPTWHEIRALGADHYRTVLKWPEERVQALMGHMTLTMTRGYLAGHGERWQHVEAG